MPVSEADRVWLFANELEDGDGDNFDEEKVVEWILVSATEGAAVAVVFKVFVEDFRRVLKCSSEQFNSTALQYLAMIWRLNFQNFCVKGWRKTSTFQHWFTASKTAWKNSDGFGYYLLVTEKSGLFWLYSVNWKIWILVVQLTKKSGFRLFGS